jgi:hypothetical protein
MSDQPKILRYPSLERLVVRLRDDFKSGDRDFILLFAYNGTGKTRLSTVFKNAGKKVDTDGKVLERDTLYFNAFTEDLFYWDNDLEDDLEPRLLVNPNSSLILGFKDLALSESIAEHFGRHCTAKFEITLYSAEEVAAMADPASPSHDLYRRFGNELETKPKHIQFKTRTGDDWIKISRGEERIFIWSVFLAIMQQVLRGESSFSWVKYLYIDDPVSSLDDNNAIAVASDLAKLLRKARDRKKLQVVDPIEPKGEKTVLAHSNADPVKVVVSSHHALFFNVVFNELKAAKCKHYFLHRSITGTDYTLRATDETPFFHHVAMLSELKKAAHPDSGKLYTYHFNMLRSILEKTATFFGKKDFSECLEGMEDEALYSRALNLLSHGKYSLYEPVEMLEDNKQLFREILAAFLHKHAFDLPALINEALPPAAAPQVVPAAALQTTSTAS